MARLPNVGGDEGNWGTILNDYLSQSHAPDGTLTTNIIGAPQLKQNAVTSAALAPGAVTPAAITDATIPSTKLSDIGKAGGVASLDGNGNILAATGAKAITDSSLDAATAAAISNSSSAVNAALSAAYATLNGTVKVKQTWDTIDAQALRTFRVALANRNAAPCNILHIGDSITWGYAANSYSLAGRWASILRDTLRTRFPNTVPIIGGFGYYSARQIFSSTYTDSNLVNTGGSDSFGMGYGLDAHSRLLAAGGDTQRYTFTGTGLDLFYVTYGGGGTFSYSVDSGIAVNVNTNAATNNAARTQIRALIAGSHTVDITYVSGATIYVSGIMAYNGDENAGIRSWVAAFPSTKSSDWWNNASPAWMDHIPNVNPHLVTIELGPNDYAQNTVATFKANVQSIIARIKFKAATIPSFVLTPTWPLNPSNPPEPWSAYVTAMYQIATEDPDGAVCVFDWQERTTNITGTTAGGILDASDKTHLSPLGNRYIGEAFAYFVSPR